MTRALIRGVFGTALVCLTASVALAQTAGTQTQTKKFEVIAVEGNQLVVKLPEGTRELTVPDDFRFNVDGKQLSVRELKPGMAGTATITTTTTVTPVTVTEVKEGIVTKALGTSIIVATGGTYKMFSQSDIDKRGVKIYRAGKPAEISDFRENDRLTATIVLEAAAGHDQAASGRDPCQRGRPDFRGRAPCQVDGTSAGSPAARGPSRARRRRKSSPRPPAPCRLLALLASRHSVRGWASL